MHVLINSQSGTVHDTGPEKMRARVQQAFEAAGCAVEVELLGGAAVAARIRELVDERAESVIVGGGDGTVTTAASIVRGTETALGILPLGTFNLLGRDLEIPMDLDAAAEMLVRGRRRAIDVAEVNGRLVLCICVAGFYPSVAARSRDLHTHAWWLKAGLLVWETTKAFMRYRSLTVEIEPDNGSPAARFRTRFFAVANNRFEDLFGVVPRRLILDGGLLAAYVSEHHSRAGLVRWMLYYLMGKWEADREITLHLARRITIRTRAPKRLRLMIDGELVRESTPLHFECFPKSLTVIA